MFKMLNHFSLPKLSYKIYQQLLDDASFSGSLIIARITGHEVVTIRIHLIITFLVEHIRIKDANRRKISDWRRLVERRNGIQFSNGKRITFHFAEEAVWPFWLS